MPFYLYETFQNNNSYCYKKIRQVQLAGYNAIYDLWVDNAKPIEQGWHIKADDLIKKTTNDTGNYSSHRIIVDLAPRNKNEIFLLELLDIYLYTYGDQATGKAHWSPLMLRLRDVYYCYSNDEFEDRLKLVNEFYGLQYSEDIFEFLYIQGNDKGFVFGPVGSVNGALIHKDAKNYFKKYF